MLEPIERVGLFVLYQFSIAVGILLLPVAVLARRAGVTIPVHRMVERLDRAYEDAARY